MDVLQGFMTNLNDRVETLHCELEQLRSQSTAILSELRSLSDKPASSTPRMTAYRSSMDLSMEHKDVLSDSDFTGESGNGERSLTPEVQVQRLTAQLTAAYNRIAALEEQLLAQRIH